MFIYGDTGTYAGLPQDAISWKSVGKLCVIITENPYSPTPLFYKQERKKKYNPSINIHLTLHRKWQAVIWFANVNIHFSSTYAFTPSKLDKGRTEDILLRFIFIVFPVKCISRDVREL